MITCTLARRRILYGAWLATPLVLFSFAALAGSIETATSSGTMMELHGFSSFDPPGVLRAGHGCITIHNGADGAREAASFGELACRPVALASPHELSFQRGEMSWKLQIVGGDERNIGDVRSGLSFDHALGWPVSGWQLHAEAFLERPATGSSTPIQEQAHLSLGRGLPAGWNLLLTLDATALGALDPSAATAQSSEWAAVLSRSFRLGEFDSEHRVKLKTAEQTEINLLYGTDQRRLVTSVTYAHALDRGALAADAAYIHLDAPGTAAQSSARMQIKYSARF